METEEITQERVAAIADEYRQAEEKANMLLHKWREAQLAFHQQQLSAKGIIPMTTVCIVSRWLDPGETDRAFVSPNNRGSISVFPVTRGNRISKSRSSYAVPIERIEPEPPK